MTPGQALSMACEDSRDLLSGSGVELARRLGYTPKHISEVFHDKAPISMEMALRLEFVLRYPAMHWIELQMRHDLDLARRLIPTVGTSAHSKGIRSGKISKRPAAHGKKVAPGVGKPRA